MTKTHVAKSIVALALVALLAPPFSLNSFRFRPLSTNGFCQPYPCGAPRCTREGYPINYFVYPCFPRPAQEPIPPITFSHTTSRSHQYTPRWI